MSELVPLKTYLGTVYHPAPEKRVPIENVSTVVVLSDIQIPFEDPAALNKALEIVHKLQPDMMILNGDIIDCYAESDFLTDPEIAVESITQTHSRVRELMGCLRYIPHKIWLGGNHEHRWQKVLWGRVGPKALYLIKEHEKAVGHPISVGDPLNSFKTLYDVAQYGFSYYPWGHRLYLAEGNLIVTHGQYVSKHSGYSAKRHYEWLGKSCIIGHTHRQGTYRITTDGKEHGAWENGCLCQLEPEYAVAPNWQQGFSIVKIDGSLFHVVQVPIVRRGNVPVAIYGGLEAI